MVVTRPVSLWLGSSNALLLPAGDHASHQTLEICTTMLDMHALRSLAIECKLTMLHAEFPLWFSTLLQSFKWFLCVVMRWRCGAFFKWFLCFVMLWRWGLCFLLHVCVALSVSILEFR
jgi:hypothetical protein